MSKGARTLSTSSLNQQSVLPKLVAFDLNGTIWSPDMYQLWGGGAPFKADSDGTQRLFDKKGSIVKLLGRSSYILEELKGEDRWSETVVAWVSSCDEPKWAEECLQKFKTSAGKSIGDYADSSHIYGDNKQVHFKKLKAEFKSIDYSEMIFFDNQMNNINSVSKLGVHCVYCPEGMTQKIWDDGLIKFTRQISKTKA
eukprot:CAMPEP_0119036514 /NCGR_PEP_ID=MMETSP1177-20130426/4264_1 /TAXON_ID=2985 /ORGANISM="Ochromonas sp, Strain CCMP1899" /LENGTH=196 /DNA_ID=CAMNT_0006996489 /DNA_START=85 /DNA_END=675 /DNA_ORIENTATION=+